MENKIFTLPQFAKYLNVSGVKENDFHIVHYAEEKNQLLKSGAVNIDFYMLSLKPILHKNLVRQELWDDQSNSYIYIDCPNNSLEWDIEESSTGYTLLFTTDYLKKLHKKYSFLNYTSLREALFIRKEEADVLWDLYKRTYEEFQKINYSKEIILNYITLILTYTQTFYDRQFENRSKIYHTVVSDFYENLENYFGHREGISGLPSVAYFAQKSFLSPNYFGDLIKHLTGNSPINHIQDFIVEFAKKKLKNTNLSISEISYSLGFDYPNYFARFFRKKTGLSPKAYRNQ
ncbi:MAG: helix-turn-helix domain-containing protein [Flavobacterium sp.]